MLARMADLLSCRSCGTSVSSEARLCPTCGAYLGQERRGGRAGMLIFLAAAFALGAAAVLLLR